MADEWKYEVKWQPKGDITTWELARSVPYLYLKLHEIDEWDTLGEDVTRHFIVKKVNYSEMIRKSAEKLKKFLD